MRETGVEDYYVHFWTLWVNALTDVQPHLLAYLIYMVQRLIYMKPILKNTGSIYLHCDPTASHYIKVMMDGIFGHQNFRNEIIWKRTSAHSSANRYGPIHDTLLFYTKSDTYTWNPLYQPYDKDYLDTFFDQTDPDGRRWKRTDMTGAGIRHGETGLMWRDLDVTAKGRHWGSPPSVLDELDRTGRVHWPKKKGGMPRLKQYPEDLPGVALQDIWADIKPLHNLSKERLGYPTQKPIALMKRVIAASSNPGDVIFDPFCGCGTTVYATQELGERTWIGCDVAILAIKIIRESLAEWYRLAENVDFTVDGVPPSVEAAQELFERDAHQFQHWAVERVGGFPLKKKGADRGIDGRIYFESTTALKCMVLSVKGGKTGPADVRDLAGVLNSEPDTELAGFICLHEPTKAMHAAAASAGMFTYQGVQYPCVQILSIREILEQKREFRSPSKVGSRISSGQVPLPIPRAAKRDVQPELPIFHSVMAKAGAPPSGRRRSPKAS
jgi:DNA modification methylase